MEAANQRIGAALKGAFFPDLMLTAALGSEFVSLSKLFTWSARAWSLGQVGALALSLPVFDNGLPLRGLIARAPLMMSSLPITVSRFWSLSRMLRMVCQTSISSIASGIRRKKQLNRPVAQHILFRNVMILGMLITLKLSQLSAHHSLLSVQRFRCVDNGLWRPSTLSAPSAADGMSPRRQCNKFILRAGLSGCF